MEFYLSKILNFFINPLYILCLVILIQLFIIFFIHSKKLVIFFSKLFLILFLFFGYSPLSTFLLSKIEDYIQSSKYPAPPVTTNIFLIKFKKDLYKAWQRPTLPCLKTKYHWR